MQNNITILHKVAQYNISMNSGMNVISTIIFMTKQSEEQSR